MLNHVMFLAILIALVSVMIGCETENPISINQTGDAALLGQIKEEAAASTVDTTDLRIIRAVPATHGGAATAPSLVNSENGADLEFDVEHEVNEEDVYITVIVDNGALVSYDYIKVYVGDTYLGRIRVPKGSYWSEVEISVDIEDLPTNEEITLTVKVERGGEVVAEGETEEFELETSVEVEIRRIKVTDDDELTITFDESVEVSNRRDAENNITLTLNGEIVDVSRVLDRNEELVIYTEEELESGDYELTYNGEGGITVEDDDDDIIGFSVEFEIEEKAAGIPGVENGSNRTLWECGDDDHSSESLWVQDHDMGTASAPRS